MSFSCQKGEFDRFFNRLDRPVEESRPDWQPDRPVDPTGFHLWTKGFCSVVSLYIFDLHTHFFVMLFNWLQGERLQTSRHASLLGLDSGPWSFRCLSKKIIALPIQYYLLAKVTTRVVQKKLFLICFSPRGLKGVFWCKNNPCKFFWL